MDFLGKDVEIRKYVRRNKATNVVDIVKVSNRNNLPVEEHLRLLNLNDPENEYSALPDDGSIAAEGSSINITLPKN